MLSNFQDFKMTSIRYSQIEISFPSLKIFATRRLVELVWDHQQYTNWCFPLTLLPECLLWRALCCPKDIPKCRNQLLFLDNVPLPLKLSIHHSVWTCLDLSQKIKLYTFLRPRIDPTKDGIPQGLTWESYTVLCEVARWHQLPNFCTASEPFCYLPWKTWGCGGTHGFSWGGGILQSIQMSNITLSAWHYHRIVCLLDYIFSPRYRWPISFTVLLQFCWTPSRKTEVILYQCIFSDPDVLTQIH